MSLLKATELPLSLRRNPDAPQIILDTLRTGAFLSTACAYAGINVSTFKSWLETGAHLLGKMEDEPFDPTPAQERLMEIALEVTRAEAASERAMVGVVYDNAVLNDDWKAAAWMLEHRHKERWRPSKEIEMRGQIDVSVSARKQTADDLLSELAQRLDAIDVARQEALPAPVDAEVVDEEVTSSEP